MRYKAWLIKALMPNRGKVISYIVKIKTLKFNIGIGPPILYEFSISADNIIHKKDHLIKDGLVVISMNFMLINHAIKVTFIIITT